MRIGIGGINHETNTYCPELTPLSAFPRLTGERLLRRSGTETPVGGAIDACRALGVEPIPLMAAWTQPSGIIEASAYDTMKQDILDAIAAEWPLDGIFLDLHGAGVAEGVSDLEGDLTEAIRAQVGSIPIVATFDLHGNVTQRMADQLDGVFACHEYPHIDLHHRAREAIELVLRMQHEGLTTERAVVSIPMLMPTTTTFHGIGKATIDRIKGLEKSENLINISWFHGFPYADTPHVGVHLVLTGIANQHNLVAIGESIATSIWAVRDEFRIPGLSANEALEQALNASSEGLAVINETSDNPGGGSPGDGTHLLKAMLEADEPATCFGFIVDPE
ncbi:MAG: M81 family metallopeptidase, partial [Pseudomonadales bacterium]